MAVSCGCVWGEFGAECWCYRSGCRVVVVVVVREGEGEARKVGGHVGRRYEMEEVASKRIMIQSTYIRTVRCAQCRRQSGVYHDKMESIPGPTIPPNHTHGNF